MLSPLNNQYLPIVPFQGFLDMPLNYLHPPTLVEGLCENRKVKFIVQKGQSFPFLKKMKSKSVENKVQCGHLLYLIFCNCLIQFQDSLQELHVVRFMMFYHQRNQVCQLFFQLLLKTLLLQSAYVKQYFMSFQCFT